MAAQNQIAPPIEAQLETLPKYHLQLSFFMCFHQKFFHWDLCSLNVVLTSTGVQKNMLKAWDFTKNKLCHRHFDNHLQKTFRTIILEIRTGQVLLIVILMVGLWLKLQMGVVDLNDSIFTSFLSLHIFVCILRTVIINLQRHFLDVTENLRLMFMRE